MSQSSLKKHKHKKAMIKTSILFVFLCIPTVFLYNMYSNDLLEGVQDLGPIKSFELYNTEEGYFFLSSNSSKKVSLLITCSNTNQLSETALENIDILSQWALDTLVSPHKDQPKPENLTLAFAYSNSCSLSVSDRNVLSKNYELYKAESIASLLPNHSSIKPSQQLLATVISQDQRYAGIIDLSALNAFDTTQRLLSRHITDNYLFHFMSSQGLMFKKAGRYARGDTLESINKITE